MKYFPTAENMSLAAGPNSTQYSQLRVAPTTNYIFVQPSNQPKVQSRKYRIFNYNKLTLTNKSEMSKQEEESITCVKNTLSLHLSLSV